MNTFLYHLGRLIALSTFGIVIVLVLPATLLLIVLVAPPPRYGVALIVALLAFGDGCLWNQFRRLASPMSAGPSLDVICRKLAKSAMRVAIVHMVVIAIAATALHRFYACPDTPMVPVMLAITAAATMLAAWWVFCEQSRWSTEAETESLHT